MGRKKSRTHEMQTYTAYDPIIGYAKTGGPTYRDNIHDFKGAVFGYAGASVLAMVIIHWVVLNAPYGHAKWQDVVSANGTSISAPLSLGERQRIAIAHAAIEALALRSGVTLITHRLEPVRTAQRIVVVADGRIVETGTHAALMGIGGEYARLWSAYHAAHVWRAV